jgi:hypothetical protein
MKRLPRHRFQPRLEALEDRWCPSTIRPISDFLNAQGQTSLFPNGVNPGGPAGLPDEIGWTKPVAFDTSHSGDRFARVDYTGQDAAFLLDQYGINLGTTTLGTISERILPDGTAEDTVILHTHNAFAWAVVTDGTTNPPVVFGYLPSQLVANPSLHPPLADSDLQVVIHLPHPGAPLPDLVKNLILGTDTTGDQIVSLSFRATATGTTPAGQQATLVVINNAVGPLDGVILGRPPKPIPNSDLGFTAVVVDVHIHGSAPAAATSSTARPTASETRAPGTKAHAAHWSAIDAVCDTTLDAPLAWDVGAD